MLCVQSLTCISMILKLEGTVNMVLNRKQFDILEALASNDTLCLSQRGLEKVTPHSLGTINRTVRELNELGLISNGRISDLGLDALEPYRVKRAIFIAAGFVLVSTIIFPFLSQGNAKPPVES